jgi:peptidoglycan/xylan/chitin deacetylase (PgdA/CDA1 family)
MGHFAVLMYHRIESSRCPVTAGDERPWSVTRERFSAQLDRLVTGGGTGVSMHQVHEHLASGRSIPPGWVAITFDDGNESDVEDALPMLLERGFRATFFVCGERIDAAGGLSTAMLRELHAAGMHIGSHAMTHRFLTTLSAEDEAAELRGSRERLESIVGATVDHFAPPGGRWSARTRGTLHRLGYRAVSTSRFGYNDASRPAFAYRRLPVVRSTAPGRFDAMIRGDRVRLVSGYTRDRSLGWARALLGEAAVGRARAERTGKHA